MPGRNELNGAQVIVDYLIREKVPNVFGLCGHGNIQFIDALFERSADIKTISVHHESVGPKSNLIAARGTCSPSRRHSSRILMVNPSAAAGC